MTPPDRERILRELGLSEYASRAYLALLDLGPTEARDVSRLAKVPVAKIYSTLDQLALKGFLTILPETPRRYAPEPMARIMKRIEDEHQARARETRERAGEMETLFPLARKDHASDRGATVVLRGRRVTFDKLDQLAEDASDILTLASDGFALRATNPKLKAHEKHRILRVDPVQTGAVLRTIPAAGRLGDLPNRRNAPNPVSISVFDDTATVLTHHVPDDARQHEGHDVTLLIQEEAIVRTLRDVLEHLWSTHAHVPRPEAVELA